MVFDYAIEALGDGWAMKAEMTAQLVTDALIMAIWRRCRPDSLLRHSDRGSQYTSATA